MTGRITLVDPATEEVTATYETHTPEQIEDMVARGSDAAARWGRTPLAERVETLKDLARELRSASPRLCGLVVEEMGKPVAEARAEVEKSAVTADHYAAAAPRSSPTSRSRSVTLVPGWPTSRSDSCSR